jgi:hypothetical protein
VLGNGNSAEPASNFNCPSIPSMAAERREFAFLLLSAPTASLQHPGPFGSGSPEAAVDKRMKQAKGPCCATAAAETGYAGDWRSFAASSRSAYAHASALAHSRGHVSEKLQGPVPGVESMSEEAENRVREAGTWEAVNCEEIRGSRIANDFARRRVRPPVHGEHVLIEKTGNGSVST